MGDSDVIGDSCSGLNGGYFESETERELKDKSYCKIDLWLLILSYAATPIAADGKDMGNS